MTKTLMSCGAVLSYKSLNSYVNEHSKKCGCEIVAKWSFEKNMPDYVRKNGKRKRRRLGNYKQLGRERARTENGGTPECLRR